MKNIYAAITLLLLAGCASDERYSMKHDQTPQTTPSLDHIENAQPRFEPYSIAGNDDYEVMGKTYHVLNEPTHFREKGMASWYGKKFHGHLTSNGEIYDMYSMSAAHKTLPLPSYVEVKNTQNGKVAILRVNDRGPFHEGRIIDLSYAAAAKLGVLKHGTAPVEIRLLHIPKPKNDDSWKQRAKHRYYVQLIAVSTKASALQHAAKFSEKLALPTHVVLKDNMYRIRLGPFYDSKQTRHAKKMATKFQINGAFIVIEPTSNEPNTQ